MVAITTVISATISRVNERGFLTLEKPGGWYNLSKYADPVPVVPPAGTMVSLVLDAAGFVRQVMPLEPAPATAPIGAAEARQNGHSAPPARETVITRLACLKAASEFLSARPDATSAEVLTVAASWEAWVTR
jgi:hypothetical protein